MDFSDELPCLSTIAPSPCPQRPEAPLGCVVEGLCRRALRCPWVAPWSEQDHCPPASQPAPRWSFWDPRGLVTRPVAFMLIQELVFRCGCFQQRPSSGEGGPLGGSWLPLFSTCTWLPAGVQPSGQVS